MSKRQLLLFAIIATISILSFSKVYAQGGHINIDIDSTKTYKITTKDNSEYIGKYLFKDPILLAIKTNTGAKVELQLNSIKNIETIETPTIEKGESWFENPNSSRYYFSSSAFNLKKGKVYYQNTYLFLNSVYVGLTDNFSIGAGFELITTFTSIFQGEFNPIFFVAPKLGFKVTENFHFGTGILYANAAKFLTSGSSGILMVYGVGTIGSANNNISASVGWGSVGQEFTKEPIIIISGMTRVSKHISLVTENWLTPSSEQKTEDSPKHLPIMEFTLMGLEFLLKNWLLI